jgi:hypothetical protein
MAKRSFRINRSDKTLSGNQISIKEVTGLPATAGKKLSSGDITGITGYADQLISRQTSYIISFGQGPLRLSGEAKVAAQLIYMLSYYNRVNRSAYIKLISYIHTWVFTERNNVLIIPIRVESTWIPMVTDLLSSIHGCRVDLSGKEGNIISLSDCLLVGDICYKPLDQRLRVCQILIKDSVNESIKRATKTLSTNFMGGEPLNLKIVAQAQLLVSIDDLLRSKISLILSQQADLTVVSNLKGVYDYRANDILNRITQVFSGSKVARRNIQQKRDNEIGVQLRLLVKIYGVDYLVERSQFRDLFNEYIVLQDDLFTTVNGWSNIDPARDEFSPHWFRYIKYCIWKASIFH